MFVDVSAKAKTNLDELLESIVLLAEVEELTANPTRRPRGTSSSPSWTRAAAPSSPSWSTAAR
jgi:translation initiation factor IF-2